MKKNLTPVTLLTGYLGAGKTTLLNYILNNQKGYKVAVIVNDIGEVNIDATLIEKGAGIVEEDKDSIVPLQNGCICCTLKTDLMDQIISLTSQNKYDYILIEASGICEPLPIAQTIMALSGEAEDDEFVGESEDVPLPQVARLDTIAAVVDAARLVTEFCGGNSLLKKDIEEHDIEALLVQQIEFCNVILINKTDLVTLEELEQVKKVVTALQPHAKIIETQRGQVDLSDVLGTNSFDFESVFETAGWVKTLMEFDAEEHDDHHEHEDHSHCDHEHGHCCCGHHHEEGHSHTDEFGISTFVYYRRKPFDRMKLDDFAQDWPRTIIRSKGIVWFSDDNEGAYVLEQAGRQITAGYSGDWMATAPKDQIQEALAQDEELARNWDSSVGDRMIKMVFIGKDMDQEKICAALDACTVEPAV